VPQPESLARMARKITVTLTGSESLNRKLLELTSTQAKAAIRSAARPALQPTLQAARSLCPARDGKLRKSIKIRAIRRSRTRVGMRLTTGKSDNAFSGKTFYGGFIEWGWKTGTRSKEAGAVARRVARSLRTESRTAGALGKKGSEFRARQEAYFSREGDRQSGSRRKQTRRQIPGRRFLKRAAQRTRTAALRIYSRGIIEYIRKITKK
jgi:hypothetical protein